MLGSMILDVLDRMGHLQLGATARSNSGITVGRQRIPMAQWRILDAADPKVDQALSRVLPGWDWVINAIGMIKHLIDEDNDGHVEEAVRVNALFPHVLAHRAESLGIRVLQIATDCVYSGAKGGYAETDAHDPLDVYGKTKSLGEPSSTAVHHLRCSIVGPESRGHRSLLDWFCGQPRGSVISGYTNHHWNGVTTFHFGRLCAGIIASPSPLPPLQHIVPADAVTKHDLLQCFAHAFGRTDIVIHPAIETQSVDRTLRTRDEAANRSIWATAGYPDPPSIAHMINELAACGYRWHTPPSASMA